MNFNVNGYGSILCFLLLVAASKLWGVDVGRADSLSGDITRLETGSPAEQQVAMSSLAKRGSSAVAPLLGVIKASHDRMARVRAAKVLKNILKFSPANADAMIGDLEAMAVNPDATIADISISLATELRSTRALKLIRTAAKEHLNDIVRGKALTSLLVASNWSKTEGENFVGALKTDRSEFVRLRAASALGGIGRKEGLPICLEVLRREPTRKNWSLLVEAAEAAGDIRDESALPVLRKVAALDAYGPAKGRAKIAIQSIRLAGLPDGVSRLALLKESLREIPLASWAAYKLKTVGSMEAIEALRQAASETTNPARSDVQRVLNQITDER